MVNLLIKICIYWIYMGSNNLINLCSLNVNGTPLLADVPWLLTISNLELFRISFSIFSSICVSCKNTIEHTCVFTHSRNAFFKKVSSILKEYGTGIPILGGWMDWNNETHNRRVNRSSTQEELWRYRKCGLFKNERETTRAKFWRAKTSIACPYSRNDFKHIRCFPLESNYGWLEYFSWSHRIRDNESQLYIYILNVHTVFVTFKCETFFV
jgi:hypothetical protein